MPPEIASPAPKKKQSRPRAQVVVKNPNIIDRLEEFFRADATDEEACAYAGIGERTFYNTLKRDKSFAKRIRRAQYFPFILMKKTVIKAANAGDGKLALRWLKARQSERYHEKTIIGADGERNAFADIADSIINPKRDAEDSDFD